MTATLEQLDDRLTALEVRVDEQERLRAGQDSDLSDVTEKLRAQDKLLKSIAATQSDHGRTLARHTAILDRHTALLSELKSDVAVLTVTLYGMKDAQQQIVGMLDTLIARDDR